MKLYSFIYFVLNLVSTVALCQSPGIQLDLNHYWQADITSKLSEKGAKFQLSNYMNEAFLRLGSTHENLDIFYPFINWQEGQPLLFNTEDPESTMYQARMRVTQDGHLRITELEGGYVRNLVALPDGTIRPQDFGGFGGVLALTAHDFVSYGNPGDDHNYNEDESIIYHENQLAFGNESLVAPVHLPHGSVIQQINIFYKDDHPTDTISFWLRTIPHATGAGGEYFFLGDSEDSNPPGTVNTRTINMNKMVDNLNNFYYLRANDYEGVTHDWPGDKVGITSVNIIYTITEE